MKVHALISLRKWKVINCINYSGICRPACGQNLYNIPQPAFEMVRLKCMCRVNLLQVAAP